MATSYQRRDYSTTTARVDGNAPATWWQIGLAVLAAFGVMAFGAISSPSNDYLSRAGHAGVSATPPSTAPSASSFPQTAVTPTANPGVQGPAPVQSHPAIESDPAPTEGNGSGGAQPQPSSVDSSGPGVMGPLSPTRMQSGAGR